MEGLFSKFKSGDFVPGIGKVVNLLEENKKIDLTEKKIYSLNLEIAMKITSGDFIPEEWILERNQLIKNLKYGITK